MGQFQTLEDEIDQLHVEGRSHPPVAATLTTQLQLRGLIKFNVCFNGKTWLIGATPRISCRILF
jgi:hypothetical protein